VYMLAIFRVHSLSQECAKVGEKGGERYEEEEWEKMVEEEK
jgi:hypothetical protein